MDRNKEGCGPSCQKHPLELQQCGTCRLCGGKFMSGIWYTKEEAAEIRRKSQDKELRRQERLNIKKQEKERKDEAKKIQHQSF